MLDFEQGMIRSLSAYMSAAFDKLGYRDRAHVEAGLVKVDGFHISMPSGYTDHPWGPIYEDVTVQGTVEKDDPSTETALLLSLFEKVFDAAGMRRPKNLNGFPS